MIRIERRRATPTWLRICAPLGALVVALIIVAFVLIGVGNNPLTTYHSMFNVAFTSQGALTATLTNATPLLFTGLCAVVAFRMRTYNIGGEGQLYAGAVATLLVALLLAGQPAALVIPAMIVSGIIAGGLWAAVPGLLRSYLGTNEILTSLMLNYVAGLGMLYLIFDSNSYLRDLTSSAGKVYPQSKPLVGEYSWPSWNLGGTTIPLGLVIGVALAIGIFVTFKHTRLGFKMRVTAGSPTAARYAGFKVSRLVLLVMLLSGMLAGLGGASQIGDFSHILDPKGLEAAQYGYTGIVVAALGAFDPLAVILSAVFFGALLNASVALNGAAFPEGLVGMIEGIIIFCVVSAAMFTRYRVRLRRVRVSHAQAGEPDSSQETDPTAAAGEQLPSVAGIPTAASEPGRATR